MVYCDLIWHTESRAALSTAALHKCDMGATWDGYGCLSSALSG
jgi:hypothetical protein